jgi:hypothetical protein
METKASLGIELPVNIGLILKADDLDLAKLFLLRLQAVVEMIPGLELVYKNVSADRLWVERAGVRPEVRKEAV